MPTFKNIRVPVGKSGKTRLQRVQVLKSGKFKFVKNIKKSSSKTSKRSASKSLKRRSSKSRNVRKTGKGKMFRTVGAAGAAEDIAWGFIGFTVLGKTPSALPMTRTIQGIQGIALNRRGKSRLVPGILDLITLWLAGGFGGTGAFGGGGAGARDIVSQFTNALKLRPL